MEKLEPCPFCGGTDVRFDESRLSPTMKGPGALISVTLRHWCPKLEGQPHGLSVTKRGRDHESARAAWNTRAGTVQVPLKGSVS